MKRRNPGEFPFEAARDLLGIVRALYASAKERGAPASVLKKNARVGADLARAIDLASSANGDAEAIAKAWRLAESATARAADLVDALTPAEPIFSAARARMIAGVRPALRKKAQER